LESRSGLLIHHRNIHTRKCSARDIRHGAGDRTRSRLCQNQSGNRRYHDYNLKHPPNRVLHQLVLASTDDVAPLLDCRRS
jgi:hypothetical protein